MEAGIDLHMCLWNQISLHLSKITVSMMFEHCSTIRLTAHIILSRIISNYLNMLKPVISVRKFPRTNMFASLHRSMYLIPHTHTQIIYELLKLSWKLVTFGPFALSLPHMFARCTFYVSVCVCFYINIQRHLCDIFSTLGWPHNHINM